MATKKSTKKSKAISAKPAEYSEGSGGGAPVFTADFECVGPDGQIKWASKWKNAVQFAGKVDLMNQFFGRTNANPAYNTWYVGLHNNNATHSTFSSLSDITASEVGGYSGGGIPSGSRASISFGSVFATNSGSASMSYAITAGTSTVSGAFIANSAANATAGVAGKLYSAGNFAASRQVQVNDTLNVTVTVSFA